MSVRRGNVIEVDLNGAVGSEKQKVRPCVVVQNDVGNFHSPLTIVVPLTDSRQNKHLPVQVLAAAEELGFVDAKESVVECGHIRTVDKKIRVLRVLGSVNEALLARIDQALAVSLGLAQSREGFG